MAQPVSYDIQKKWWLLRHLDPKAIDQALMLQNEQRAAAGLEAFVYVIPHQYAKEATYKKNALRYNEEVDRNNNLRSTLHYYLFIKGSEEEILQLVGGEWNRMARCRLTLCRSKSGDPLWAKAEDMDRLMEMMIHHREMFNLVPAPFDYQVGDTVMLKTKMFDGYEFNIRQFSVHGKGVNLTLEMPLFNGRFIVRTKGKNVSRDSLPVKLQQLLSPGYVREMEQGLIEILRSRYPRNKHTERQPLSADSKGNTDFENLNNFHFISYMKLDDSPAHHHIRTLLLLCAALRRDRRTVEYYVPIIEQLLADHTVATTDEEAFMMAVLYVATHDVAYRNAAKQYQQTHDVASESLSRLLTVIKYIHFRADGKKRLSKKMDWKVSRQVKQTLRQICNCNFSSLTPEALSAISVILSLPQYDTDEGHALRSQLQEYKEQSAAVEPTADALFSVQPLPDSKGKGDSKNGVRAVYSLRETLVHNPFPPVESFSAYYRTLLTYYPDRSTPDASDLYTEFIRLLLATYTKVQPLSSSWWILKSILEHYHYFPFLQMSL